MAPSITSRVAGRARSTVASTTAVAALAPNASSTPVQIDRNRSRCPVFTRKATTAPITRIASNPSRRMISSDCRKAPQPLAGGPASSFTPGNPASMAFMDRSALRKSRAPIAPLKSAKCRSSAATVPGLRARAGVSSGSNAM